ncbi:MAG: glycosyltransferase family 4 protein [Verrucomicrobia bacterium]|nr:glycosyltransferase family 4 protein [Verrucomicrobiota bacterium]
MRVTHVITRLIVGGAQENTVSTVFGLRGKPDVQVDLISGPATGPEGSLVSQFGSHPELLKIVPELVRPVYPLKDIPALRALTRIFRETKPDIVHTHSGKAGVLGRLAARRAGVPVIVHTIHGPSFGAFQGALPNLIFRSAERYAARATTHFISVANAMTEQYLAAGIGQPEQYTRVFSGFDIAPFSGARNDLALRQQLGLAADDFVVGKIARLFELKGHDDLFAIAPELVQQCPRMKFLFVGDGKWRQKFEFQARSVGLEKHFIFTGLVPPREVPKYVGIMDALVHLSRREGLPRALPQAMAAGKPVVAYDCDGAREVCLENETGFLVSPGDEKALSNRLLQLANDNALRIRLGATGRTLVTEYFPVERMVDHIHELYRKLLSRERPS